MTTINPYNDLKGQRLKLTTSDPFAPTYVKSHLTQCSDPAYTYASRIQGRSLILENPVRGSRMMRERGERKKRAQAQKARKRIGVLGRKEAELRGIWKLDPAQAKFELFRPLHHLWLGYMSELLSLPPPPADPTAHLSIPTKPSAADMHVMLVKADFHGSIMSVRQSKNPCLEGLSGIVIHESANAFKIVTKDDKIKLLPKQNSVFTFAVPLHSTLPLLTTASTRASPAPLAPTSPDANSHTAQGAVSSPVGATVLDGPHMSFDLYGNQFRFRAAERAGRKFKWKETIEL